MTPALLGLFSIAVRLLILVPILVVLLSLFQRTQMKSFLWLIGALVAWPLLAAASTLVVPVFAAQFASARGLSSMSMAYYLSFIYLGEALIGGALLFFALLLLSRELNARMQAPSPPPPPPAL